MARVHFFERIVIDPPKERIYRRLGYRRKTTILSEGERKMVDETIERGRDHLHLRGASLLMSVLSVDSSGIELPGGVRFDSARLASFLEGCEEVLLMGATGGGDIIEAIARETEERNLAGAVVLDAAASEMVDASLDWIAGYHNNLLRREGKSLMGRRYSAGYGDFDLLYQKDIYELLEMHRLGVSITEQAILVPEKSVTAITGIVKR